MNDMFKKVNAREKLVGWYHTGPKLRASDLEINELFKRYTPNPLLVIIDVQPKESGVPTDAYFAVEEIKDVSRSYFTILSKRTELTPPLPSSIGWHHHLSNICPHAFDYRGRGGRGDWCRAPTKRYPRCCRGHSIHACDQPAPITSRTTSPVTRYRSLPPESSRWPTPGQPCDPRKPTRRFQPSP